MNKTYFISKIVMSIMFLYGLAITAHAAFIASQYSAAAPVVNGVTGPGEWNSAPAIMVGNAFVHFRHTDTHLYLLVDQPDNTTLDIGGWPSDLITLTFDVNRDSLITSGVDVMFGPYPVSWILGKQYYLGAYTWTPLNATPATYSIGFGPSLHSAVNHVVEEYVIPFTEIGGALNQNVRFGIRVASGTPLIDVENPANHQGSFASLINILLFKPGVVVGECPSISVTGDLADLRGIRFQTNKSFNQFQVEFATFTPGWYHIKAVIRQSTGFTAAPLRTIEQDIYLDGTVQAVFGFPLIEVNNTVFFTVAFEDITGPSSVYMGTAGIGSYPCPNFIVTEENDVAVPTPRSSATGFALMTAACYAALPADINKDCKVDLTDLAELSAQWLRCNLYPDYLCN